MHQSFQKFHKISGKQNSMEKNYFKKWIFLNFTKMNNVINYWTDSQNSLFSIIHMALKCVLFYVYSKHPGGAPGSFISNVKSWSHWVFLDSKNISPHLSQVTQQRLTMSEINLWIMGQAIYWFDAFGFQPIKVLYKMKTKSLMITKWK